MTSAVHDLVDILCCPKCRSRLEQRQVGLYCTDASCLYAEQAFPISRGQPVLIDFERSIFSRDSYAEGQATVIPRPSRKPLHHRLKESLLGSNKVAPLKAQQLIKLAGEGATRPRILVVGGGTIGSGAEALYEYEGIQLVSVDVYASANTDLVCDGHQLPFDAGSFDAVWIQAVLEHVLEPKLVVSEIVRVLKPGGLVYADTPFMQPVHERAYDFTRFSMSGHRWLFRDFEEIDSGAVGGAGTTLQAAIRYFARSIFGSEKLATAVSLAFFWLRFLDGMGPRRANLDAASGTYFFGTKSGTRPNPPDIVPYYDRQMR